MLQENSEGSSAAVQLDNLYVGVKTNHQVPEGVEEPAMPNSSLRTPQYVRNTTSGTYWPVLAQGIIGSLRCSLGT